MPTPTKLITKTWNGIDTHHKLCPKCGEVKIIHMFGRDKNTATGVSSWCKSCKKEYVKARYHADPDHRKRLIDGIRRRAYGITDEEYEALKERQDGKCAICGTGDFSPRTEPSVDHCHETGQIRGLLCTHCNTMLGLAKENKETLLKAIKYLEKANGKRSTNM